MKSPFDLFTAASSNIRRNIHGIRDEYDKKIKALEDKRQYYSTQMTNLDPYRYQSDYHRHFASVQTRKPKPPSLSADNKCWEGYDDAMSGQPEWKDGDRYLDGYEDAKQQVKLRTDGTTLFPSGNNQYIDVFGLLFWWQAG